jgi:hypothetical protein
MRFGKILKNVLGELGVNEEQIANAESIANGAIEETKKTFSKENILDATEGIRKDFQNLTGAAKTAYKEMKDEISEAEKQARIKAKKKVTDSLTDFAKKRSEASVNSLKKVGGTVKTYAQEGINTFKGKTEEILKDPQVKAVFDDMSETAKSLFAKGEAMYGKGEKISENAAKNLQIKIAKTSLQKRMRVAAKKAGFTPTQANLLAVAYFSQKGALTKLTELFPDKPSEKLQSFLEDFYRKNENISHEAISAELLKPENQDILTEVLKEIRISVPEWYAKITEERLDLFFSALYQAYEPDIKNFGETHAFQLVKEKMRYFI